MCSKSLCAQEIATDHFAQVRCVDTPFENVLSLQYQHYSCVLNRKNRIIYVVSILTSERNSRKFIDIDPPYSLIGNFGEVRSTPLPHIASYPDL